MTTGITAATTAASALVGLAVDSYAEYEQLVGGVETLFNSSTELFGTAANRVLTNANLAYKTAGLSANAYMDTVTSFSASLLQSLEGDTQAAVDKADMAITDMSDNANKMGSSMESIQNAYQGFAKQNYTMLDNLKLGYGGTKEEMARLLEDAAALSGIEYDISSYADIVDAIHVVQTEMGITGTTAREASTTIEGSLNSAKAAWSNLLVGIADDSQDFDMLLGNFVDSVVTAAGNLIPRIETSITGVGNLVEKLLPVIVNKIPGVINGILPELLESGINMVQSILSGIEQNLPQIMEGALLIVDQLLSAFLEMLPQLIQLGTQIILQLVLGIGESLPTLIPAIVEAVLTIVDTLIDNIDLMVDAAIQLAMGLAEGLISALPILIEKAPEIIMKLADAIVENAPKLLEAAYEILMKLNEGLDTYLPQLLAAIPDLIISLVNKFLSLASKFLEVGKKIISELKDAMANKWEEVKGSVPGWIRGLIQNFMNMVSGFSEIGSNIVRGIWNGISAGWDWLIGNVKNLASNLLNAAKDTLGIHSPSREFAYLGRMCTAGFEEGIEGLMDPDGISRNVSASLGSIRASVEGTAIGRSPAGLTQVINVNREISTPDELARAVRVESRLGLIKGVGAWTPEFA